MPSRHNDTVLVDQATEAFKVRLAQQIEARRARSGSLARETRDPGWIGEEAADFVAARLELGRSALAERIGPVYRTEDLSRWLTSPDAGPLTGEAVRKRGKARQLVAVRSDDGQWAFPAWQFDTVAGRLVPRKPVIDLWREMPHEGFLTDADLAAWMNTRLKSLDGTPVDHVLARGRTSGLEAALRRLASRVAA